MLPFIRSPWFAAGAAALATAMGLVFSTERPWLFSIAGTAAFWGIIDWISGREVDREV